MPHDEKCHDKWNMKNGTIQKLIKNYVRPRPKSESCVNWTTSVLYVAIQQFCARKGDNTANDED